MKIPYIKLYTADLLAASRHLTVSQIGAAVLGVCESAFDNNTHYVPEQPGEAALFDMLECWKEESKELYRQHKKSAKKAAQARWHKPSVSEGAPRITAAAGTLTCQTETDTETETKTDTETDTETKYLLTAPAPAAQAADE